MADTTTMTEPWGPHGTQLQKLYGYANTAFGNVFNKPYDPFGATSKSSLAAMKGVAAGDNPFQQPATDAVAGIAGGDYGIETGDMFGDIYGQSQQPGSLSEGMYGDVASGGMVDSNPFADDVLRGAMDDTEARIKASMSASGRLGSDYYGEGMARGLGTVASDFGMQRYNADMDRMMRGAESRSGENLSRMGVGLSAAQGATGVQDANLSRRLEAAGMAPGMSDFRFADIDRMAKVGAAEDSMASRIRNQPMDDVSWYQSIFGMPPGSAGSVRQEEDDDSSGWLDMLGLGLGAAGVLGSFF